MCIFLLQSKSVLSSIQVKDDAQHFFIYYMHLFSNKRNLLFLTWHVDLKFGIRDIDCTKWPCTWIYNTKKVAIEIVHISKNSKFKITLVINLHWTKRVFIEPLVADLIFGSTFNGSNFAYKYSIFKELE